MTAKKTGTKAKGKAKTKSKGHVIHAGDVTFARTVTSSGLPVLVDFWAPWCGPCQEMGPVIEQVAEQYEGRLKVLKVNVDRSPVASTHFNIKAIPTLILFVDGKVKGKIEGFTESPQLVRWLSRKSISPASDDSKNC